MVSCDPFQPTNGDRFGLLSSAFFDPGSTTGGLTGSIAGATQHPWKHIRDPIDHIGVGISTLTDQADVFRYGGVCGASPLAIDDAMKIFGMFNLRGFQNDSLDPPEIGLMHASNPQSRALLAIGFVMQGVSGQSESITLAVMF